MTRCCVCPSASWACLLRDDNTQGRWFLITMEKTAELPLLAQTKAALGFYEPVWRFSKQFMNVRQLDKPVKLVYVTDEL